MVYVRDDRPWSGPDPPAALYLFSPDRKGERPAAHLQGFRGTLQVDGYAGFERLTDSGRVALAACWAHTRRKFYELAEATGSPIATEALARIAALYSIEADIRGRSAERAQGCTSGAVTPAHRGDEAVAEASATGRGKLAEAIRYALSRWNALCRFLDDGRVELDTNPVERAIRPVTLGRKNYLFAGSDGGGVRWATASSLIETCKLNGVEPYAYLSDVLRRMVDEPPGKPARRPAAVELETRRRQRLPCRSGHR